MASNNVYAYFKSNRKELNNRADQENSFTIISQQFHNERALYLATHLDLEIKNVQAFHAQSPTTNFAFITYVREYLARVKMFIDIITKKEPQTLEISTKR